MDSADTLPPLEQGGLNNYRKFLMNKTRQSNFNESNITRRNNYYQLNSTTRDNFGISSALSMFKKMESPQLHIGQVANDHHYFDHSLKNIDSDILNRTMSKMTTTIRVPDTFS